MWNDGSPVEGHQLVLRRPGAHHGEGHIAAAENLPAHLQTYPYQLDLERSQIIDHLSPLILFSLLFFIVETIRNIWHLNAHQIVCL